MNKSRPYGDPRTADLCIIGHDSRLQESDTEAEYVFFMNYLERGCKSSTEMAQLEEEKELEGKEETEPEKSIVTQN